MTKEEALDILERHHICSFCGADMVKLPTYANPLANTMGPRYECPICAPGIRQRELEMQERDIAKAKRLLGIKP